jgi:hypothetical protein
LTTTLLAASVAGYLAFVLVGLAAAILPLWRGRRCVVGTTLVAAWVWAMVSWCSLLAAFIETAYPIEAEEAAWIYSHYFAAAATTFCPGMAVLGAKRPQHIAWQWVVLALWVVLASPAAQWEWLATEPSLHGTWQCLLLALIAMGVVNYLPTRHAVEAILFGVGQWLLLSAFLPGGGLPQGLRGAMGMPLIYLAICLLWRPHKQPANEDPLERLWRDFRDLYGLLWGLRVAERFNTQAKAGGRTVTLSWGGFHTPSGSGLAGLAPEERQAVVDNLSSWLRRFVDGGWIEKRLGGQSAPSV